MSADQLDAFTTYASTVAIILSVASLVWQAASKRSGR
jgi:hypothetical protein